MDVFQRRPGHDGEAIVVCFGALVAFLQAAPTPRTRKGVVLGVLLELLERPVEAWWYCRQCTRGEEKRR